MATIATTTDKSSPPPLPDGWKAEWSTQYNRWYVPIVVLLPPTCVLTFTHAGYQVLSEPLDSRLPMGSPNNYNIKRLYLHSQTLQFSLYLKYTHHHRSFNREVKMVTNKGFWVQMETVVLGETVGGGLLGLANSLVHLAAKLGVHEGDNHKIQHFGQSNVPGGDRSQFGYIGAGASTMAGPPNTTYRPPPTSENRPPGLPYGVSGGSPASFNTENHPETPPGQIHLAGHVVGLPSPLTMGATSPLNPNVGRPTAPPPSAGPPPDTIPAGTAPSTTVAPIPPPCSPPAKIVENFSSGSVAVDAPGTVVTEPLSHHGMDSSTHSTPPPNFLKHDEPRLYIHCAAYADKT
jgi:hypothetical protein